MKEIDYKEIILNHTREDMQIGPSLNLLVNAMKEAVSQAIEIERESKWIALNDKAPAHGQRVVLLVMNKEGKSLEMFWSWEKTDTKQMSINYFEVTHWMPVPKHPESPLKK